MSNVVPFQPGMLPAHLQKRELSPVAKALMGGGTSGKRLSIRGGVFRLLVGGKEIARVDDRYLDVVIVAAAEKVSRVFYTGTFDEDNPNQPPSCWSADGELPSPDVKEPQSSACATCPMNAKGSGQGDSRACRYNQRIAVVLANDMEGHVLQVSLPAMSLFGKEVGENRPLQAYARWLAAQGISPDAVVTRMRFDTDAATPKLFFSAVRWLEAGEYATCQEQGASHDAQQAVTFTVYQQDNKEATAPAKPEPTPRPAAATPAAKPKAAPVVKPKPQPAPAPVAAEEPAQEEPPAPTVRTAAPAPATAAKKSLAELVDTWDDEDE